MGCELRSDFAFPIPNRITVPGKLIISFMTKVQAGDHIYARELIKKPISSWGGEYSPKKYRKVRRLGLFAIALAVVWEVYWWITLGEFLYQYSLMSLGWVLCGGIAIAGSFSNEQKTNLILYARSLQKEIKSLRKETGESASSPPSD